jgi:asparagine synthase (glutamine-hydrolysing)
MCGFVAVFDRQGRAAAEQAEILTHMARTLRHRGPDDDGRYFDGPLGLYHLRLSIIDLAGGHQPMHDAAGHLTIVFNGEIYNYVELRTELEAAGAVFRTRSDTEVILQLYALHGEYGFGRLIGMFAFFLYDRGNRRAVVARDHFGIKPLYWQATPGHLAFASEIKALLAHPGARAEADAERLGDYMTLQLVPDAGTLFSGVNKVLPGHLMVVDLAPNSPTCGEIVRDTVFWEPQYRIDHELTEDRVVDEVRALIEDSVRMQVRADVPIGAHLSGGTDSSIVSLLAARHCPQGINLYHGRFAEGPEFDESEYARAVARQAGDRARLVEIVPSGAEFAALMPRLIWHMDEPVAGPGLFPQYMVSARARQDVKVALGGQGGDELFAGYTRYLVAYLEQTLKGAIQQTNDEGEHILNLTTIVPNLPELRAYQPLLKRFWRSGLFGPMDARYFRLIDRLEDAESLLTHGFRASLRPDEVFARFQRQFDHPGTRSYLNKMLAFDLRVILPALLHVEDRVSMAVSLESRVPLLDWRLADLAGRVPARLKFPQGRLKHLLRQAFRGLLPPQVYHRRDKMGFPVPLHRWAATPGPTADLFRDTLHSQACRERGLFDAAAVERAFSGSEPFSRRLWGLLSLELWFQTFIDAAPGGRPPPTPATLPTIEDAAHAIPG